VFHQGDFWDKSGPEKGDRPIERFGGNLRKISYYYSEWGHYVGFMNTIPLGNPPGVSWIFPAGNARIMEKL
jgi:hypothetical protein